MVSGGRYKARAVVKVVNDAGVVVNNVSVTGDFSGAIDNPNHSDDTNPNGNATITSASTIQSGSVTFTVTAINTYGVFPYNAASNVVTSATIAR